MAEDCHHILVEPLKVDDDVDPPWGGYVRGMEVFRDGHDGFPANRTCPALVRVVEQLGAQAAHPEYAGRVGVVTIPDDVKWYIEVDDETSSECVAEQHQTWGLDGARA